MTTDDSKKPGGDAPPSKPGGRPGSAAGKAADKLGKGTDGAAGNAAGEAVKKSVSGDGSSAGRQAAGRYAGSAASGAVGGAQKGGAPGAAAGAAKNVAVEGAKDAGRGASKAVGGSPVAQPADKRMAGGGQGSGTGRTGAPRASSSSTPGTEGSTSGRSAKTGSGATAPGAGTGGLGSAPSSRGRAGAAGTGSATSGSASGLVKASGVSGAAATAASSSGATGRGTKQLPGASGSAGPGSGPGVSGSGASRPGTGEVPAGGGAEKATSAADKASDAASGAEKTADAASTAGKAAETAQTAGKTADALDKANKGLDGAKANLAGSAAQKAVAGDGSSQGRQAAGRYAGAITSGAVSGAEKGAAAGGVGALPGAAIGAAKNVAIEGGKDAVKGAGKITGGGPSAEAADKRLARGEGGELGAGGTSKSSDPNHEGMGTKAAKGAAVGGAAVAAPQVTGLMMLMKLLKMLQLLMLQMAAVAVNAAMGLWSIVGAALSWLGKTIAAPFVFTGGVIAKAAGAVLGISVGASVAPAAAVTSGVMATAAAVAMVGSLFAGIVNTAAYTGGTSDNGWQMCTVGDGGSGGGGEAGPVDATVEEQARLVYSVFKEWGMPDENIAGILGNWDAESGIDPTSVQNFPVRTYTMTSEKQSAAQNTDNGIGLGQWTFGRNSMLRDYAADKGLDWWTLEAQLAFMAEGDNPSDRDVFLGMIETSQGTPAQAAIYFHDEWERSADTAEMAQRRADKAEFWYGKMSGWEVDSSIAGRIDDIIGGLLDGIVGGIQTVLGNCEGGSGSAVLTDGGMTFEDAEALMVEYNETGDAWLNQEFGGGGPGQCNGDYVQNCVSFSWYFVTKYTTYDGGYAPGNGKDVAASMASAMGKETSGTPTPYSVFSHPNNTAAGHTGIVLGIDGDRLLIGEAGYCAYEGRARWVEPSEWKNAGWTFTDVSDILTDGDAVEV